MSSPDSIESKMEEILRELGFPPLEEIDDTALGYEPAENETLRIETKGETAEIFCGCVVLWRGPSSGAPAELESLIAAAAAPLAVTGRAIRAALAKFPGLPRAKLENAADAVMDELEAVPVGEERMAAAEKAIADCIDRIVDAEAKRTNRNRMEIIEELSAVDGKLRGC
jgi:hypothetical protein